MKENAMASIGGVAGVVYGFLWKIYAILLDLLRIRTDIMNDKEKIKKAAMFIDSFLVRTNTNLKKCASSKDLPEKESIIDILESQKRVLEKIKEILT